MERDERAQLEMSPDQFVRPYGAFGDSMRVRDCSSAELDSVARRNTERAVERSLRNIGAVTQA